MSIGELDSFLDLRNTDPVLDQRLGEAMDLARFLELAREHGFILSESDVFEAQQLSSSFSLDWRIVAAGSVVSILPVLLLFILLQRFILPSASGDAVKG